MKLHLLIVDDEEDILDFLERVFRRDYILYRASSGEQALQILEQHPVEILITDQKMPGMTGLQLLEAMKQRLPNYNEVTKVLLSGYADVPDIVEAIEKYGIHQYVVKPVDSRRLREAVQEARERTQSRDWSLTGGTDPGL